MTVSPECLYCQHREDTLDALTQCQRAKNRWTEVQPILQAVAGQKYNINMEILVFQRGLPTTQPAGELFYYITTTAASILWQTRNQRTFDKNKITGNVDTDVKNDVKRHIRTDLYINPNRVEQLWGYKNILVKVDNEQLKFNI